MLFLQLFSVMCLFVFLYHYERNGNPVAIGDTFERIVWSIGFGIGFLVLNGFDNPALAGVYSIGGMLEIYVPHAWVQNMGAWATPQKKWPGFFLKDITTWTPNSPAAIRHDFLGMAGVGFFRGLIVFVPPLIMSIWLPLHATVIGSALGWALSTFGQPGAYLLGRYVPFALFTNPPRSAQWGEFLVGVVWGLALACAAWL